MRNCHNSMKDLAAPVACFYCFCFFQEEDGVCFCVTLLCMFLAGTVVWGAGAGGGGLFLKCWWAYWKCVRQGKNAGRGWESACTCEMHGDGAKCRLAPLKWSMCIWTCLNVCMCGCILKAALLWPIIPPPCLNFKAHRGSPQCLW